MFRTARAPASNAVALVVMCLACQGCDDPPPPAVAQIPLVAPGPRPAPPPPPRPRGNVRAIVSLITMGNFPREMADAVEAGLRTSLAVDVRRMNAVPLPRAAYYPPRRRYRAERLLDHLRELTRNDPSSWRVLGMTDVDISTTKGRIRDWGIFGLGDLGGRSCVISTFRLQRGARDAAHYRFRVVTTAVHEVGHTLGLDHCIEPNCLMRDAEGSIETVDSSTGMGAECRAQLDRESPRVIPPLPPPGAAPAQ